MTHFSCSLTVATQGEGLCRSVRGNIVTSPVMHCTCLHANNTWSPNPSASANISICAGCCSPILGLARWNLYSHMLAWLSALSDAAGAALGVCRALKFQVFSESLRRRPRRSRSHPTLISAAAPQARPAHALCTQATTETVVEERFRRRLGSFSCRR